MSRHRIASCLVMLAMVAACSAPPPAAVKPESLARSLPAKVTAERMLAHLRALQDIAGANGGNRADGSPGFDASVQYVSKALQDKGFDVSTTEFKRLDAVSPGKPALTVGDRSYPVVQASLLIMTPPGGVNGPVLRPRVAAGCAAGDFPKPAARGAIAVVDDAACSVVDKQKAAAAAGAAALIVISPPGRNGSPPGLFVKDYYNQLTMPVAVAGTDAGTALSRASGPVRLVLDAKTVQLTSRNVLAQTKTGAAQNVVMVGAHLDGPARGPGANNNGSGVAAVLETALQLGPSPSVANAVRFAFWGGSLDKLAGSLNYVSGLNKDALNDIAVYLNADELASPNAGFFTYDGDQSGPPSPDITADEVPSGSAGVERTLAGYLNLAGKRPADMPLSVASDDSAFLHSGVPIGGLTTGSTQTKTVTQARLWGGNAGAAFDPNRGTARDDLAAVNRDALAVMGAGIAFGVGTYADSIDGVNGVPPRDVRHRVPMGP